MKRYNISLAERGLVRAPDGQNDGPVWLFVLRDRCLMPTNGQQRYCMQLAAAVAAALLTYLYEAKLPSPILPYEPR